LRIGLRVREPQRGQLLEHRLHQALLNYFIMAYYQLLN
jgi:hypothetical protein